MNKPTEEQKKKFWEWCGFAISGDRYYLPGITTKYFLGQPELSLNNLFKYAVPKLQERRLRLEYVIDYSMLDWGKGEITHYWSVHKGHSLLGTGEDEDPALALFWAIYFFRLYYFNGN